MPQKQRIWKINNDDPPHLEHWKPPEILERPLVHFPEIVEAEVDALQGLQAVKAAAGQGTDQVVAGVKEPRIQVKRFIVLYTR